ncbi:phage tail-collar fiber domain-containing protein [Photobacterium toruni]|uniref:Tail fiber protein n=1 Tax=Photobacterium toruni TaxID=1935446 RepID=A0A1T4PQF2_9GAMM|nr:phage tail protein [Photobacterium toruni]SJZ93763.1 Tail fiber protein [Photobacterium toruni]
MSNTATVITTKAGEALIAQMQAENKVLVIDKFIFANVPNRPAFPNRGDVVPTEHVVHESEVHEQGRLTENSVIYSTTLASNVGPFSFNWSGLFCSEHNVLVAINFPPPVDKTVDAPGITGNTLVRSFVLEYKGIAETTNITVDPSSWQYDAHKRMSKMDNDTAQAIIDQNGKDWFIDDGFIVTPQSSAYSIKAGAGYVSGHRISLEFDRIIQVPEKPVFIYVDAFREGSPTGEWQTKYTFVVAAEEKGDYTDAQGVNHFVCKIAQVFQDGSAGDLRLKSNNEDVSNEITRIKTDISSLDFNRYSKYKRASFLANKLADGHEVIVDIYGDSTAWGSIPFNTLSQDSENSAVSLEKALNLIYPNQVEVNNCAIPATTLKKLLNGTDGGNGTYAERIAKSNASIIYSNHCLNDCNSYQSDENEYRENLIDFINITRSYGKIPVIVTPTIIAPIESGQEFMMKRMPAFIETQRKVAEIMNVDLVDNYYYSCKSSRYYKVHDIAPDGVHLSRLFYQMAGRNMAIPLLNVHVLKNSYDLAGLSTSNYYDSISKSRAIWYRQESEFSSVLTGDRSAEITQDIYFPIVLDNPTDNTILSVGGLQGPVGGVNKLSYFGEVDDVVFNGLINYKREDGLDYNSFFIPSNCKIPSGLAIVGVCSDVGVNNDNFNFSGVKLLNRNVTKFGSLNGTGLSGEVITSGCELTFNVNVSDSRDNIISLSDVLSDSRKIAIFKRNSSLIANIYDEDFEIVQNVQNGFIGISLVFSVDTVLVRVGSIQKSIDVRYLPNMYVSSDSLYSLRYI